METKVLNAICIFLSIGFLMGTAYVWRGQILDRGPVVYDPGVQIKQVDDFAGEIRIPDPVRMPEELLVTSTEKETLETPTTTLLVEESEQQEVVEVASMNLDVPFTSQAPEKNWDQPWQDACEEAAVLMMDAYYRNYKLSPLFAKDEMQKMVNWETEKGWGGSIEIEKIQQLVASKLVNQNSKIIEDPTVDQIKAYLSAGHPVYVVADGKALPNPHFQNDGPVYHALVIRGFTETKFITNDPGTQFGENFMYKYDDLMNAIRDWNGGDVQNGRRVVLVFDEFTRRN